MSGRDFTGFALDVDKETSTLLKYDIVCLGGDVKYELTDPVKREGRIIYKKI